MTRRWLQIIPILAAALVFYLTSATGMHGVLHAQTAGLVPPITSSGSSPGSSSPGSPAADNLQTIDTNGNHIKCKDIPAAKGGVLLGRIVPCLTYTIEHSAETFSEEMIKLFKPLLYAFLVFVVALYGVKLLQGDQELHQQGILMMMRVTLILIVLELIPHTLIPASYGILNESVAIVTTALGPDSSSIRCDIAKFSDSNTPLVWAQMDCLLGKLYGFSTGNDSLAGGRAHNMVLGSSIIGLLSGFFFGGSFGFTLFLMCIGMLVTMFMVVARVVIAFVNGYLIICVMLMLAPLFLPLVLLQVTGEYFKGWWKAILGAFLLPVIMTAYAMFALLLYDKMLFAPDAEINKLFDNALVQTALAQPRKACSKPIVGDLSERTKGSADAGLLNKIAAIPQFNNLLSGNPAPALDDPCKGVNIPAFDIEKVFGKDKKQAFFDLFKEAFKFFLLAYLIAEGAKTITGATRALVGSGSAAAALSASSPQEVKFQQKLEGAKQAASQQLGNNKGTDFVASLPRALGSAAETFTGIKPRGE